jgi:translation elongation factor EF-1alpha
MGEGMESARTRAPIQTVVIGHVDHGKSTLIGRLLYDSGRLPQEQITELQARAELYRRRFEFSHFLDAFREEVDEERTIDTTRVMFHAGRTYEVADVPGHAEFTRNMLTGAGEARVAILVVSIMDGIESQTLEHLRLVAMLGVEHLLVAVTKLDQADRQEHRFQGLVSELEPVLSDLGFQHPVIVPTAPTMGHNVLTRGAAFPWFGGPSLVEALDGTVLLPRSFPTRVVIQDSYALADGPIHVGQVLSGRLRTGDALLFQPSRLEGTVLELRDADGPLAEAAPGDCVGIRVSAPGLSRGDVGGPPDQAPTATEAIEADVVFLEPPPHPAEALELVCGPQRVTGIIEPTSIEDPGDHAQTEPAAPGLHPRQVTIRFPDSRACLESHADVPKLGRFILFREGRPCGVGVVRRNSPQVKSSFVTT